MFKKVLLFCTVFTLLFLRSITTEASPLLGEKEEFTIVIDPGHGGENLGTISNENFEEKEITMKTARALVEELSKYEGVKVLLTHEEDVDLSLKERAIFAQEAGADFLFSLHYNASEYHTMFGSEVWIPLEAPYHALGYQFAYLQQLQMQDMGLFIRGIKTRINNEGTDYYGIIRECVSREIPAVIIEHCYVDEARDAAYVDGDEDFAELGRRDAYAIAQFLGLEPYHGPDELLEITQGDIFANTYEDTSIPDVCEISVENIDYANGTVTILVDAADYDTPLMYYDYSIDGGETYSKLYPWPESDMLQASYDDSFSIMLEIPAETTPRIQLRAYNKFDIYQESNVLSEFSVFKAPSDASESNTTTESGAAQSALEGVPEYQPVNAMEDSQTATQLSFKRVFLFIGFALFWLVLLILMGHVIFTFLGWKKPRHRK